MIKAKKCPNCVLPMKQNETWKTGNNKCDICNRYEKRWKNHDWKKGSYKFSEITQKYSDSSRSYDCIVPVSGGKDSSYVLYYLRKKLNLRTLAVNYDNGFQSIQARRNINSLVKKLNTGLITYTINWNELRELYKIYTLKSGGDICATCNMGVSHTVYKIADQENIPLIIWGYSPVLENTPIYGGKRYCREKMYKSVLKNTAAESLIGLVEYDHFKRRNSFRSIFFFEYFRYSEEEVLETLKRELAWEEAAHGSNKTDCAIFPIANYLKIRNNGYGRLTIKKAALVRDSQLNREQAIKELKIEEPSTPPSDTDKILSRIGLSLNDFDNKNQRNRLDFVETINTQADFEILKKMDTNIKEKAKKLIEIIKHEVIRDGGDIFYCGISDDFLLVKLSGDCVGCFLQQVMSNYIDTQIIRYIPELKGCSIINN